MEMNINFKIIPGLEDYAISRNGVVKALPKIGEGNLSVLNSHYGTDNKSQRCYKERILKQFFKQRYWYVNLTHNGIKKDYRVHRLVYITYKGNIPKNMVIDHIDGNTSNNNINNLRCVTQSKNCQNLNTIYKRFKPVLQIDIVTNKIIAEFPSCKDALISLGFNYKPAMTGHIGDVCNNKRKTCYGYKWKWKEESL
nr:MAG: zinc-binding loop region of homing endonuclease [Bacteriophage sp.]